MNIKSRNIVVIIINLFVVLLEIYSLLLTIPESGFGVLKYFTDISNILALFSSLFYAVYKIKTFNQEFSLAPNWLKYLKLFSACMLFITFLVVVTILAPLSGGIATSIMLFFGSMLYHHCLCPIIHCFSFIVFENDIHLKPKDSFISLFPILLYGTTIIFLNVINVVHGPYPFLYVHEQTVFSTIGYSLLIIALSYVCYWFMFLLKKPFYAISRW